MKTPVMFSTYFQYRIAILGEPQVGKTCILNQLVNKRFDAHYVPTLETDMEYLHEYKGRTYVCLIVDTAGVQEFPAMRRLSITRSNGYLLVFDLTIPKTFEKVKLAVEEVLSYKKEQFVNIILVGNKKDLADNSSTSNDISEMARCLCTELDENSFIHCQYFEVCARDNAEITNMFVKLLDLYDAKHLQEGNYLIANTKNRRRLHDFNTDENAKNLRPSRFSSDLEPLSAARTNSLPTESIPFDHKQKRCSLRKGLFSSSTREQRKVAKSLSASSNLLQVSENNNC